MNEFDIELDLAPAADDLGALSKGLSEHSEDLFETPGFQPIALFARDKKKQLQGGIYARTNWNWLSISKLWVNVENRGSGLGSALLRRLESEARARGCQHAHVDTFSFQAEGFYVAHDYEKFAELADYPEGYSRIYLRKTLIIA